MISIGFVGMGKMGSGMISRVLASGNQVIAYDRDKNLKLDFKGDFKFVTELQTLVSELPAGKRLIWLMVPAGEAVDSCIQSLLPLLSAGDILIDGGNSNFHDTKRRYDTCKLHEVSFVDVGTSGGIWGENMGFCMMIGGDKSSFDTLVPVFDSLTSNHSYSYIGAPGSGHYVKMVHNAVEYGLMQAYAEGVDLLENGPYDLSIKDVIKVWNNGGVVRSWLLDLAETMLEEDPNLSGFEGYVEDSGTGKWAVEESLRAQVPTPVLTTALYSRFRSRRSNTIADRFVAGLRNAFGGHAVKRRPSP